jgi:hypothetical protein
VCGQADRVTIAVAPLAEPELAYEIDRAVWLHDTPGIPFASFADYRAALDAPIPGHVTERYLAMIDGEPTGRAPPASAGLETADVEIGGPRPAAGSPSTPPTRTASTTCSPGRGRTPPAIGWSHRGHRLGLIIKIENLRYARQHRPGLRAIDTFNASANEHMLDIKDGLPAGRRLDPMAADGGLSRPQPAARAEPVAAQTVARAGRSPRPEPNQWQPDPGLSRPGARPGGASAVR